MLIERILKLRESLKSRKGPVGRLAGLVARAVIAALKLWGGAGVRKQIWDFEFKHGCWDFLDDLSQAEREAGKRDVVLDVLDSHSHGRSILDLGCGKGRTGWEIADTYHEYVGVDISAEAIRFATAYGQDNPARKAKNNYLVADISNFTPPHQFSIILFRESLPYIPTNDIRALLEHYARFLSKDGVLIVRLHDRMKFRKIQVVIDEHFQVLQKLELENSSAVILVFAPRWQEQASS